MSQPIILIASIVGLLTGAFFSEGYHQIDEHFQILEFAGYKLGITSSSELPWEFRAQIRSAFQPAIVYWFYKAFTWLKYPNPFWVAISLRMLSAIISFCSMVWIYQTFKNKVNSTILQKWFLWASFLSWFLFYIHVRFSSENWAGVFFCLGFSYFFLRSPTTYITCFVTGLLFGLAFLCRYQSALLIFGFGLWFLVIQRAKPSQVIGMLSGFLLVFFLGLLIDHWFYGGWPIASFNYFKENIIQNRVETFGVTPWWFYFKKMFEDLIPPFSIIVPLSFLFYFITHPKSPVTWSLVPFLAAHIYIGHKETRFLFPLIGFVPYLVITFFDFTLSRHFTSWKRVLSYTARIYVLLNYLFCLLVIFRPAKGNISLYRSVYNNFQTPTTLYYLSSDPYFEVFRFHFYSRPKLTTQRVSDFSQIPLFTGRQLLLARTLHERELNVPFGTRRIYATYPDWLYPFHQKGWLGLGNTVFIDEIVR